MSKTKTADSKIYRAASSPFIGKRLTLVLFSSLIVTVLCCNLLRAETSEDAGMKMEIRIRGNWPWGDEYPPAFDGIVISDEQVIRRFIKYLESHYPTETLTGMSYTIRLSEGASTNELGFHIMESNSVIRVYKGFGAITAGDYISSEEFHAFLIQTLEAAKKGSTSYLSYFDRQGRIRKKGDSEK